MTPAVTVQTDHASRRMTVSLDQGEDGPPPSAMVTAEAKGDVHARAQLLEVEYERWPGRGWRLARVKVYGHWFAGDRNTWLAYVGDFSRHSAPGWVKDVAAQLINNNEGQS